MGPNFLAQLATITKKSLEIQIEEKEIVDVVITFSFFLRKQCAGSVRGYQNLEKDEWPSVIV